MNRPRLEVPRPVEKGKEILNSSNLNVIAADDLSDAAEKDHRALVSSALSRSKAGSATRLLEHMFASPVVSVAGAAAVIDRSFANANTLIGALCELGLLEEITGRERDRLFRYTAYVELFRD